MLKYKSLLFCPFLCKSNEYRLCEIALKTIKKIEKAKILVCIIIGYYPRKRYYQQGSRFRSY